MKQTFFFYDLETSGLSARNDRIMQFAGQRTDAQLQPIGEPYNVTIKLNDDTLPSPEAVMVTHITPQSTQLDGLTEAEFADLLLNEIFIDDTITVGFNSIRFDDEFIRHLFWRTFRDPYEWCWKNGCSRWDILDVIRMTRALRPEGIEWPVDAEGRATNRLELITKLNGITHQNAHDALSDVEALIDVTRLLQEKQPRLFEYLLSVSEKKAVQKIVNAYEQPPFVYTSGRYAAEHNKTTVAVALTSAAHGNVAVYDLRHDPTPFLSMSEEQIHARINASWEERKADGFIPVPVKTLQYNRCPAVAPLGVLEQEDGWNKINLSLSLIEKHRTLLLSRPDFAEKIRSVLQMEREYPRTEDAEARLYDGFVDGPDKVRIEAVRNANAQALADFSPAFSDDRLAELLLRYKARNYPQSLSEDEAVRWESWRADRLRSQLPGYITSLQRIARDATDEQWYLLEELQLWAEAVMPAPDDF